MKDKLYIGDSDPCPCGALPQAYGGDKTWQVGNGPEITRGVYFVFCPKCKRLGPLSDNLHVAVYMWNKWNRRQSVT